MKVKFTFTLLFVLCLALSAFGQNTTKKDDKSSSKMSTDQMLMNNERAAWKALEDKRWDDFGKMFTDDYQGFYSDGIHDKAWEINGVKQAMINNVTLSDIKVSWIDKDAAIVTAVVKGNGMGAGGKMEDFTSRTTSIWKKSGKNWMVVYHSDIPAKPM
ncbi:MAG TPA: nuclear transport factor 2 family protein [Pyrinomonadaceae bacterium]|jgi:hypothetical protein